MTTPPSSKLEGSQNAPICIDLEEITAEDLLARYTPSPQGRGPLKQSIESPHEDITTAHTEIAVRGESVTWEPIAAEDDPFGSFPSDDMSIDDRQEGSDPQSSSSNYRLRQRSKVDYFLKQGRRGNHQGDEVMRSRSSKPLPKVVSDMPRLTVSKHGNPKRSALVHGSLAKARFILAHRAKFLPLLPKRNRVLDMLVQAPESEEENQIIAYEEIQQPSGIKVAMKPHQLRGLSFLVHLQRNGMPAILADEMGLGKTGQVIATIQSMRENQQNDQSTESKPSLVVCPLSVLNGWIAELKKWAPHLEVLKYHGPSNERLRLRKAALNPRSATIHSSAGEKHCGIDVLVTTYETYASEITWFKHALSFNYAILDEGHRIKNAKSAVSKLLQGIRAEHRLIVTGTPVQNDMRELWSLLHWLLPDIFSQTTSQSFGRSFDLSKGQVDTKFITSARELLKLLMIRRMKHSPEVDLKLPPKQEIRLFVPLTPIQRYWYTCLITKADPGLLDNIFGDTSSKERACFQKEHGESEIRQPDQSLESERSNVAFSEVVQSKGRSWGREQKEKNTGTWRTLMNLILQLRKVCNHPYMIPDADAAGMLGNDRHSLLASSKFIILEKLIQNLVIENGKKILVFSCFTEMLDQVEDLLSLTGGNGSSYHYLRLDGAVCRARRNLVIRLFNQEPQYKIMLLSTKAGGLGINLTSASDVVMLDEDWNPQVTLQAESRSHRIGQTKPVTVYKICTQGTVEEQMLSRLSKKLYLSSKIVESSCDVLKMPHNQPSPGGENRPQLGTEELMSVVRGGAQAMTFEETDTQAMSEWTWETMLKHCQRKTATGEVSKEQTAASLEYSENQWLQKMERVQTRVFEGKALTKRNSVEDSPPQDLKRADRRIGKNTTVLIDGYYVLKASLDSDWIRNTKKDLDSAPSKLGRPRVAAHQEYCQLCFEPLGLLNCSSCPRAYHPTCLSTEGKSSKVRGGNFFCPQHHCCECEQKTNEVGGMLYRCRCCAKSFCEDCLDWDNTQLLGETLKEFELLGFNASTSIFYIKCSRCINEEAEQPLEHEAFTQFEAEINKQHAAMFGDSLDTQQDESGAPVTPMSSPNTTMTMPILETPRRPTSKRLADAIITIPDSPPTTPSATLHSDLNPFTPPNKRKFDDLIILGSALATPSDDDNTIVLDPIPPPKKHKLNDLVMLDSSPATPASISPTTTPALKRKVLDPFTLPKKRKLDDVVMLDSSPMTPASMSPTPVSAPKRKVREVIVIN